MKVRLFARARDLARTDLLDVDVPPGATVRDLRLRIAAAHPALAVNDEFADDGLILPPEAEIALLPPVSGGG
jgi:molybdopterin converting factor small subunit